MFTSSLNLRFMHRLPIKRIHKGSLCRWILDLWAFKVPSERASWRKMQQLSLFGHVESPYGIVHSARSAKLGAAVAILQDVLLRAFMEEGFSTNLKCVIFLDMPSCNLHIAINVQKISQQPRRLSDVFKRGVLRLASSCTRGSPNLSRSNYLVFGWGAKAELYI